MSKRNFLIGRAEALTYQVPPPKINPQTNKLYTWEEVLARLTPQIKTLAENQAEIPEQLCPGDLVVSRFTMHPSYIAKGFFPKSLLRQLNLVSVGSKATKVTPDKWNRVGEPEHTATTEIMVAGQRSSIAAFSTSVDNISEESSAGKDLTHLWSIDSVDPREKIKAGHLNFEGCYEVGLGLIPGTRNDLVLSAFESYAKDLGCELKLDLSIEIASLWFVPVIGEEVQVETLAQFSFVRVVRPMPALRAFQPVFRSISSNPTVVLPDADPYSTDTRAVVLDGGLPDEHCIGRWVRSSTLSDPLANNHPDGPEHGIAVTSAVLFGPLSVSGPIPRPFSYVDHIRVLDDLSASEDPYDLYRTLSHVEDVLVSRQYEFINLSLGPDLPIDDDEVHPWTAVLDSNLSDGQTILTVAAGNNGALDSETQLSRIQVPSDCVNALAIGATDSKSKSWKKATYSAVGPGRSPGLVKPDIMSFGGDSDEYFHVLGDGAKASAVPTTGTSFSAPNTLRSGIGIRAILGTDVSVLGVRTLLIHSANPEGYSREEVGWGKIPEDLSEIIESPPGVARILYQGELKPGKFLRIPLPVPSEPLAGNVRVRATCCIAVPLDPKDSSMYTRAGVDIQWRPHSDKDPEPFFKQRKIATEAELRSDAGKWETTLHAEKTKRGGGLNEPEFQIHYIARDGGGVASGNQSEPINYAFVATIEARRHPEIFTEILQAYSEILTEIEPKVTISIET